MELKKQAGLHDNFDSMLNTIHEISQYKNLLIYQLFCFCSFTEQRGTAYSEISKQLWCVRSKSKLSGTGERFNNSNGGFFSRLLSSEIRI